MIAQAQRIEVDDDRIVFTFTPNHRALRTQVDQSRAWLESIASQVAGRRMSVQAIEDAGVRAGATPRGASPVGAPPAVVTEERQQALKEQALSDSGVQAMLDVFAAEIKDIEEM